MTADPKSEPSELRAALLLAEPYLIEASTRYYDGTGGHQLRAEAIRRLEAIRAALTPAPAQPEPPTGRCTYCDGTGDVHSITGEWRGRCHCGAKPEPLPAGVEPVAWADPEQPLSACSDIRKRELAAGDPFDRARAAKLTAPLYAPPPTLTDAQRDADKFAFSAIERAVTLLRSLGDRDSSKEDPYAGLFWYDDADTLEQYLRRHT